MLELGESVKTSRASKECGCIMHDMVFRSQVSAPCMVKWLFDFRTIVANISINLITFPGVIQNWNNEIFL